MTRRPLPPAALAAVALCAGTAPAQEHAALHTVVIEGVDFRPRALVVQRGERVQWVNRDPFPHTVTADGKLFDSHSIAPGGIWTWRAQTPGTHPYHCTLHPAMTGSLTVK